MRIRLRSGDDSGVTLVETLVAMALLSVVGAIILAATVQTHNNQRVADDETRGQEDVAVVVDRLARDIRDARGVVCDGVAPDTTCTTHLQLWVDYNSNYKQDSNETITWKLQPGSDGIHYDMVRQVGTTSKVQARTIVKNVAFTYPNPNGDNPPPGPAQPAPGVPSTRVVAVNMTYDAVRQSATTERTVAFTTLLRNVP